MSRWVNVGTLMQATCDGGICSDCEDAYKGQNVQANCSEIRLFFLRTINDVPAIDIVRCKECKWDKKRMKPKTVKCIYKHKPDDYCSYGEREGE